MTRTQKAISIICCIPFIYLLINYLEIISKNIFGGATYSDYNIIVNAINYACKLNGKIF